MIPKNKLEKLYNKGLSMSNIAKQEGLSYYAVKYWMDKHNINHRSRSEVCYLASHNDISPNGSLTVEKVKNAYYDKKLSVSEAAIDLKRSESSLYKFMKRHDLPRRTASESNEIVFDRKALSYKLKKNLTSAEQKLKLAGIMLYWAEGYKNLNKKSRGATIDLANSDPKMIELFLKFLRKICNIDEKRLRVQLYCYINQDVEELKQYWRKLTRIPLNQFIKPFIKEEFSDDKKDKMKYGLVHIRYSDKKLFLQIKKWTEDYINKNLSLPG